MTQPERNRRISEGLRLAWKRRKDKAMKTAREIAARVWCDPEMGSVAMDVEAAEGIAAIIERVRRKLTPEQAQAAYDAAPEVPLSEERIQAIVNFAVSSERTHQVLTLDELTDRFYIVRGQRNQLLLACKKALAAFDEANETGKGSWSGKDVDQMRAAVGECEPAAQTTPPATYHRSGRT